ncbi:uncharacterized protein [Eurosta solidaginis]|uniref:uncharacterized protein n=1 Tax=Eurosta solidaginis TaxID=178769 RepID=UPI0035310C4B
MKLGAVNGNLGTLKVKVPPASEREIPIDTEESDEETNLQSSRPIVTQRDGGKYQECRGEDGELGGAGKKKGIRKKRSTNWEEAERSLLVEVIKPRVEYVENRNVDTKSIKAKRLAWMQITKQFNLQNLCHRSLEQIQVQWRSMKNSAKREYQQKNSSNAGTLEGFSMIEFMEKMQKEVSINVRPHVRSNGILIKKELLSISDEDTPLAALPVSTTHTSEDTLQASTLALPSPPQSAGSQPDFAQKQQNLPTNMPTKQRKKMLQKKKVQNPDLNLNGDVEVKPKKSKNLNNIKREMLNENDNDSEAETRRALLNADDIVYEILPTDEKYKKQIFDLITRSHLAEIEHARIEHEQRLGFETMHQELKLSYFRKNEELKLSQMREEHNARMRQNELEHKARMRAYMLSSRGTTPPKCAKSKAGSEMDDKADDSSNICI